MKIAVVGSRTFMEYQKLLGVLNPYIEIIDEVISGGAAGADKLAEDFANYYGMKLTVFKPDWEHLGKKAGFIRNNDIVKNCDMLFAFWDGHSKGTASSLNIARQLGITTLITYFRN